MQSSAILVTGATGFVGSALVEALVARGHDVRALTRNADRYRGPGKPVAGDVLDPDSLVAALQGVEIAYYLVHSLDSKDFEKRDAAGARSFGRAAADAGVKQIIYLGGLGSDAVHLSPHLRSRREVEGILTASGVPVTVLRAAVIVGAGGVSWEMTRLLVRRLRLMAVPNWATTRSQPIALVDVIRYLVGVAGDERAIGQVFEIGGRDQLTYVEMMKGAAQAIHGTTVPIIRVPIFRARLVTNTVHDMSARWIAMITGVDRTVARNLVESMGTEVVVTDRAIREIVPGEPLSYAEMVEVALGDLNRADAAKRTASS
ncbi:NAD(P)H-binding protein [Smaragdicoccus niigatensis]|uniref:NAD(P)H-binding protein n=1 Tax=Smaragdicoccus niigatensis TaxID=359359 RepID=UPI000A9D3EDC|nr:NAD(P)H-binding protein [Smaragdicoccus niigatensis]